MQCKILDVISVKVLRDYVLELQFDNGVFGVVDVSRIVSFDGVFAPLKDKAYFSKVVVNPEIGTICWENGADISPSLLFEHLAQKRDHAA
ncbi:MAG: hypothetical protein ACD_29C00409G0002 [uncultured bacterium]|nr:MAG: hypothetical protein ACD_29C00409G0002 [uncultured bacterium]